MTSLFLCAFLWLVNAAHPLPECYEPPRLVAYNNVYLHPAANAGFLQLLAHMQEENLCGLHLHSAYRSYERQSQLHRQKIRHYTSQGLSVQEATARAASIVQSAGASEHQLGLALDVSTTGSLSQSFGTTQAGIWLAQNAHKHGFILRYPAHKTHITNIIYEPWHIRYVGFPHAQIIYENDLVLEEYADFLAENAGYIHQSPDGTRYLAEIFDAPPCLIHVDEAEISATHYGDDARFIVTILAVK
ncbi:MAG: M15 family metallopeptidase [Defluviitaleaceae bacterium]|nr:M15 family metallopeptidase [Defluviitaleaceae bacterium]MCL2275481.1 M15 family metallopeptidase [Defluviitaleaceae bacterium]